MPGLEQEDGRDRVLLVHGLVEQDPDELALLGLASFLIDRLGPPGPVPDPLPRPVVDAEGLRDADLVDPVRRGLSDHVERVGGEGLSGSSHRWSAVVGRNGQSTGST